MTDKDPLVEIAELAEELCDPTEHVEQIYGWTKQRNRKLLRTHRTTQAGLLQQLRVAVAHGGHTEQEGIKTVPSSKPPLLIEALGRMISIEISVNEWISGQRLVNRGRAEPNIRALVGAAGGFDEGIRRMLLSDLRRWRGWAAVMSGWALPPYSPDVKCPVSDCGERATIRIVLERKTGICMACETRWDDRDGSINVLARYIEAETAKDHERVPVGSTVQGHGGWSERRTK